MRKWKLLKERSSIGGTVAFFDTGTVFESDDPHAYIVARQAEDGCSYSAEPAPAASVVSWAQGIGHRVATKILG